MELGQRIKEIRKAKGLTQEKLAQQCGVATITIRQYELGKREPSLAQLAKIAAALNVGIEDLVGLQTFGSGAEFDAAWNEIVNSCDGGEVTVIHGSGGEVQIIDHQKEHLNAVYDSLDANDQNQLVKYGDLLLNQMKYHDDPSQK